MCPFSTIDEKLNEGVTNTVHERMSNGRIKTDVVTGVAESCGNSQSHAQTTSSCPIHFNEISSEKKLPSKPSGSNNGNIKKHVDMSNQSTEELNLGEVVSHASTNSLASKGTSSYGRWTREEHEAFLEGLKMHGREWKKVSEMIPSRTSAQIRSHAQKYFAKLSKENGCVGVPSAMHGSYTSVTFAEKIDMIMKSPASVEKEVELRLKYLQELHNKLQRKLEAKKKENGDKNLYASAEKKNTPSCKHVGEIQQLMNDAVAEMRDVKRPRTDLTRSDEKMYGPATEALARQGVKSNSGPVFEDLQKGQGTIPNVQRNEPDRKRVKHSISNNEMIALEVLGTGALSFNNDSSSDSRSM